jgi:hypothetical protein
LSTGRPAGRQTPSEEGGGAEKGTSGFGTGSSAAAAAGLVGGAVVLVLAPADPRTEVGDVVADTVPPVGPGLGTARGVADAHAARTAVTARNTGS